MDSDLPITGVCIVSDPGKCPPNYTVIDKMYDRPLDADLWRDSFFGARTMRYLCVERQIPTQTKDVLVDVTLISEKDATPSGFTVLDLTHDSNEKATQKKYLCVRWMIPSMTYDAITELILTSKAQRRAPQGYTLVGDLNNMCLCYKMGKIPQVPGTSQTDPASVSAPLPYQMTPQTGNLPYSLSPPTPAPRQTSGINKTGTLTGPPEQSANSLATGHVNPISGIEWKMNPKYKVLMELQDVTVPVIRAKSMMDIERQYSYEFSLEHSVSKNSRIS